jgi:hypothetical protein
LLNLQRNVETFVELLKDNRIHELLDSQTLDENTTKRSITWNEMFNVRISFLFIILSKIFRLFENILSMNYPVFVQNQQKLYHLILNIKKH